MPPWTRFSNWFATGAENISMAFKSFSKNPAVWESTIARFEAQDRLGPPPPDGIVFTGSSSITLWKTLERDMAPLAAINRGFGGSRMADVVHYAERIVGPYSRRAVLLFAGTNDIAGRRPKTPEYILDGVIAFADAVHRWAPDVPVYYLSITPTRARWRHWPMAKEANRLVEQYALSEARVRFIDLTAAILGPDGRPDRTLYRLDRLHPNKRGYAAWTAVIKPILEADLGRPITNS